ncbi:MAG: 3-hydroxy-3-methylglutaryl-CoA lyase, partial [Ruthenibacterium sp.]
RAQEISRFEQQQQRTVIAINYIPELCRPDYLFLTNAKRYVQLAGKLTCPENEKIPTIATSNLTKTSGKFTYALNYSSLIDPKATIQDNSLMMLLRIFLRAGVTDVALAGFDGYSPDEMNYFSTNMEYNFIKEKAAELNLYAKDFLKQNEAALHITFVTPSRYAQ